MLGAEEASILGWTGLPKSVCFVGVGSGDILFVSIFGVSYDLGDSISPLRVDGASPRVEAGGNIICLVAVLMVTVAFSS